MRLADLVVTSRGVAATSARLEKVKWLAELLSRLEPDEVAIGVAYLSGHARQGRLGLGWSALSAARGEATAPRRDSDAPSLFDGLESSASSAALGPLTLTDVDRAFEAIARTAGSGSSAGRIGALRGLFARASGEERDFLERLIVGELRQGALAGVMEEAIARAASVSGDEIRRAAMMAGDLEVVARAALIEGRAGLDAFRPRMFQPIRPMLARSAEDLDRALERLGEAALEYKLDGARIQVHKDGDRVRVFSRRMNDVTSAVPELAEIVRALPARRLIVDGEAIALRADHAPQPFQVTMRRFGRRLDVERLRRELPLIPFFFDLLVLDDQDLIDAPARERFLALQDVARDVVIPRLVTADPAAAAEFMDRSLAAGHEGVMAKSPEAKYEAGSRGAAWLKVKPAHTLDLVVLAAEWGHGRRSGRLSNIHLGARDPDHGGFAMIGKTFKGMTDAMLGWQTKRFQELAVASEGHVVRLRPELVVEVAFNDVQASPRYESGVALRFARVKRYREDKTVLETDTIETVRAILEGERRKRRT